MKTNLLKALGNAKAKIASYENNPDFLQEYERLMNQYRGEVIMDEAEALGIDPILHLIQHF